MIIAITLDTARPEVTTVQLDGVNVENALISVDAHADLKAGSVTLTKHDSYLKLNLSAEAVQKLAEFDALPEPK